MNNDNRLKESRLDADHIDRLTRELAEMRSRAEKAEAIIAACLRAMPVGNVTLHTPESLADRIRFLASEVGTLARENDGLCASLSALLPKGTAQ